MQQISNKRMNWMKLRHLWYGIASLVVVLSLTGLAALGQDHDHAKSHAHYTTYGAPSQLKGEPMMLAQAIETANVNKPVRVQAEVADVCQAKGCWMVLTDGDQMIRVTFKDYGFFVPKDIAGKKVIVEGRLSEKVMSQAQARHYAEDAGQSQEEIEKIVGDQKEIAMVADTVLIPTEHDAH